MPKSNVQQTDLYKNFKNGDLIYGLQKTRDPYLELLREKVNDDLKIGDKRLVTVDQINNNIIYSVFNQSAEKYEFSPEKSESFMQDDSKKSILRDFLKFYQTVELEKLRITRGFESKSNKKLDEEQRVIHRLCKATLLKKDTQKHFILDGLDFDGIFNRTPKNEEIYCSFTSAEVRFLFRYWNQIEPGSVKFYFVGKEIANLFEFLDQSGELNLICGYLNSKNIPLEKIVIFLENAEPLSLKTYMQNKAAKMLTQPITPSKIDSQHSVASASSYSTPPTGYNLANVESSAANLQNLGFLGTQNPRVKRRLQLEDQRTENTAAKRARLTESETTTSNIKQSPAPR